MEKFTEGLQCHIRNILIGAGIIAGFLLVSEMDYRTAMERESDRIESLSAVCSKQKKTLVKDERGHYLCAPQILLTMPIK